MSSAQNPWPEPEASPLLPGPPASSENPPWTGWDVLQIALLTIVAIVLLALVVAAIAQRSFYPHTSFLDVAKFPLVGVAAQVLAYAFVLAFMVSIINREPGRGFWSAIRWNWPGPAGSSFILVGAVVYFVLLGVSQLLPIPKQLPIDQFFRTASEATVLSIISVTVAPFMEELFFRGFLYPVLVRRLGTVAAIFITAALFGLLHGAQLGYSWAVLIIFLVGLALTIVRAVTKSVAASFLTHVGYNGTLSVLLFAATSGFRHLERLTQ